MCCVQKMAALLWLLFLVISREWLLSLASCKCYPIEKTYKGKASKIYIFHTLWDILIKLKRTPYNFYTSWDILLMFGSSIFQFTTVCLVQEALASCFDWFYLYLWQNSSTLNFYFLSKSVCCCFTSQVNSYGHGRTVSSPNHNFFLDKLEQAVNQYFMHILSLVTDNNPS